jgi:hypothetical protein
MKSFEEQEFNLKAFEKKNIMGIKISQQFTWILYEL